MDEVVELVDKLAAQVAELGAILAYLKEIVDGQG